MVLKICLKSSSSKMQSINLHSKASSYVTIRYRIYADTCCCCTQVFRSRLHTLLKHFLKPCIITTAVDVSNLASCHIMS
jgi:hypothetical protein